MSSQHSTNENEGQNPPDEDYKKVGPGHPPKEHQFPPGHSGNRKGRPPKPSVLADLRRLFEEVLAEKVTLPAHGEKMTVLRTGLKQWGRLLVNGDRYARRDLFYFIDKLGIDLMAGHRKEIEEGLSVDHQAILDAYLARRTQTTEHSKPSRVFAPEELLDDDADGPEKAR